MRNMLEEGFKLSKISSQLGGGARPRRLVYGKDGMGVRFEKLAFLDESKDGGGTGEYFCLLGVKFDVILILARRAFNLFPVEKWPRARSEAAKTTVLLSNKTMVGLRASLK